MVDNQIAGEKFSAVILDSESYRRENLRQVLRADSHFKKLASMGTQRELERELETGSLFDIFFIEERLSEAVIGELMAEGQDNKSVTESAYIVVGSSADSGTEDSAKKLLLGAHGFLFEPFSVDAMEEVVAIASKIKLEARRVRVGAAVSVLLKSASETLDHLALAKKAGQNVDLKHNLGEKIREITDLVKEDKKLYFQQVCNVFENASPPKALSYKGPSERVKEMLLRKVVRKNSAK